MTDRANVAATFHRRQVDDWRFGYTQGSGRWGTGSTEFWECCGVKSPFVAGDRDCSSSVIDCWREALRGTPYEGCLDGTDYTGSMQDVFVSSGLFEWHPMGDGYIAQRGDLYLVHHEGGAQHVAMCQSAVPDMLSEFISNEFGGIVGGVTGDQTGGESIYRDFYDFPWDGILAYNGKADDDDSHIPDAEPDTGADITGGAYKCVADSLNVRDAPSLTGGVVASYSYDETVNLDAWCKVADGYLWGRYKAYSGETRYVSVGSTNGAEVYLSRL